MFDFIVQKFLLAVYYTVTAAVEVLTFVSNHFGVISVSALVVAVIAIPLLIAMWFEGVFDK